MRCRRKKPQTELLSRRDFRAIFVAAAEPFTRPLTQRGGNPLKRSAPLFFSFFEIWSLNQTPSSPPSSRSRPVGGTLGNPSPRLETLAPAEESPLLHSPQPDDEAAAAAERN